MQNGEQPSVLLVDDTRANLVALEAVLERLEVRLVEATSGREALEHAERETFAAALLDAQMPIMDGFETAKRLRALPNGRAVPLLFMSAVHRDEQYARRAYALGAADYIVKPFDPDILRARVQSYAELFRQREASHRARMEARTRELGEAQRRLEAFERIASAALETEDLDPFLHMLATVFIEAADQADTVTILLRDGGVLVPRASIGVPEEVSSGCAIPMGEGFTGRIAATGNPQFLAGAAIGLMAESPWLRARRLRALYGVPLVHDSEVIGVAYIGSTTANEFSGPEMRLFQAMADRASWAVSRQRARGRLYAVLESAPVAISILRGRDLAREFENDAYRKLYRVRDPKTGARESAVIADYCERVVRDGVSFQLDEHPSHAPPAGMDSPDASTVSRVSLLPLRDALGRPEAVLAVGVDMTSEVNARRAIAEARKEAELANRMKDEFLATVSHELRVPLNAILGWVELARRDPKVQMDRVLATVERNARAQARILEDMMDISRIVSGRLRLELSLVDVSRVLLDAVEAVRPSADAKGIALEVRLGQGLDETAADEDRLEQVIWNVLSNAVKFTPSGGRVEVAASREESGVVVRIADTGPGIPGNFLPHIFEPFRQGDNSTARTHGGLGLGMAIAKQLVVAHGGTIQADNQPGSGAVFTIRLPLRLVPALSEPEARARDSGPVETPVQVRLDGLRVLVVDDEADSRELVRGVLQNRGAIVELVDSGRDALELLRTFRPNVLVSDIAMPHVDGFMLLRHLRNLPSHLGGATPAIALTAHARAEDRSKALSVGFESLMAKPVDAGALVSSVKDLATRVRAGVA
jgi:signal transduction histidine kinase/CheY-like chemotaxis protein